MRPERTRLFELLTACGIAIAAGSLAAAQPEPFPAAEPPPPQLGIDGEVGGAWLRAEELAEGRREVTLLRRQLGEEIQRRLELEEVVQDLERSETPEEVLAGKYLKQGRLGDALDVLQQFAMRSTDGEAADAWRKIGILAAEEDPDRARDANERALELAPENYDVIKAVARGAIEGGDLDRAAALIGAMFVTSDGPVEEAATWRMKAEIEYERDGAVGQAIDSLQRAIAITTVSSAETTFDLIEQRCNALNDWYELRSLTGDPDAKAGHTDAVIDCGREAAELGTHEGQRLLGDLLLDRASALFLKDSALAERLLTEAIQIYANLGAEEIEFYDRVSEIGALLELSMISLFEQRGDEGPKYLSNARSRALRMLADAQDADFLQQDLRASAEDIRAASELLTAETAMVAVHETTALYRDFTEGPSAAIPEYEAIEEILRAQANRTVLGDSEATLAMTLANHAQALAATDDVAASAALADQAIEVTRAYLERHPEDIFELADVYSAVAELHLEQLPNGDREQAALLIEEVVQKARLRMSVRTTMEDQADFASLLTDFGGLGDGDLVLLLEADQIWKEIEPPLDGGDHRPFMTRLGLLFQSAAGPEGFDPERFADRCAAVAAIATTLEERPYKAMAGWSSNFCLAMVAYVDGDFVQARSNLVVAQDWLSDSSGFPEIARLSGQAYIADMLADIEARLGDPVEALRLWDENVMRWIEVYELNHNYGPDLAMGAVIAAAATLELGNRTGEYPHADRWSNSEPFVSAWANFPQAAYAGETSQLRAAISFAQMLTSNAPTYEAKEALLAALAAPLSQRSEAWDAARMRPPHDTVRLALELYPFAAVGDRAYFEYVLLQAAWVLQDQGDRAAAIETALAYARLIRTEISESDDIEDRRRWARELIDIGSLLYTREWNREAPSGAILYAEYNSSGEMGVGGWFIRSDLESALQALGGGRELLEGIEREDRTGSDMAGLAFAYYSIGLIQAHLSERDLAEIAFDRAAGALQTCQRIVDQDRTDFDCFEMAAIDAEDLRRWQEDVESFQPIYEGQP